VKRKREIDSVHLRVIILALPPTPTFNTLQEDKYEDASEYFVKAGNAYKLAKAWMEAGEAFEAAANCFKTLNNVGDAGAKLREAGECYKRVDVNKCVVMLREAAGIYVDGGKWNRSGDTMKLIGELFENADSNGLISENAQMEAVESFQLAADYYKNESPPRTQAANSCNEKVAMLAASAGDLPRAASVFDEVAHSHLESKLLKFNARNLMIKSLICNLANGDTVLVEQKLTEYEGLDHTLDGSLEHKLIVGLLSAVKENDKAAFSTVAADYNNVKKIDPWMTSLLLSIKRLIPEDEEDDEEDEVEPQIADDEEDLT
jgi:alpha-soluble NSF attachment protein